jgi:hypothetical protein
MRPVDPPHNQARKAIECLGNWLAEIRSNDIEGKTNFGERFAKKTRSVDLAVLYKQDPFVPHKVLSQLANRSRSCGTVRQFIEAVRIEIPRFNLMAETSRLNSTRGSCEATMDGEFAGIAYSPAIGRIS